MISVIIPAFNEENRITKTVTAIDTFLKETFSAYEIIVVSDGSEDKTTEVVNALSLPCVKTCGYPENRGKGEAVKYGMKEAEGEFILFTDADLPYAPNYIKEAYDLYQKGVDVVLGSREAQLSSYPWYRRISSVCFSLAVRFFLGMNVPDTQCGFKGFSKKAKEQIFEKSTLSGWGFDVELIYIAKKKLDLQIERVTVLMKHRNEGSKIRIISDSMKMLKEVLAVRKNAKRGIYGERKI